MSNKDMSKTEIVLKYPVSVGPVTTVKITSIIEGFDWDTGKTLCYTDREIMLCPKEMKDMFNREISYQKQGTFSGDLLVKKHKKSYKEVKNLLNKVTIENLSLSQLDLIKELLEITLKE